MKFRMLENFSNNCCNVFIVEDFFLVFLIWFLGVVVLISIFMIVVNVVILVGNFFVIVVMVNINLLKSMVNN